MSDRKAKRDDVQKLAKQMLKDPLLQQTVISATTRTELVRKQILVAKEKYDFSEAEVQYCLGQATDLQQNLWYLSEIALLDMVLHIVGNYKKNIPEIRKNEAIDEGLQNPEIDADRETSPGAD